VNQCEDIEESNRIGKTRDLSKKIRDAKGKLGEFEKCEEWKRQGKQRIKKERNKYFWVRNKGQ